MINLWIDFRISKVKNPAVSKPKADLEPSKANVFGYYYAVTLTMHYILECSS